MKGIGVSPGIVIGKAYLFDRLDAQVPFYKLSDPGLVAGEIRRFRKALRESEKQLLELKNKLGDLGGGMEPLYIIDVHIMIMRDRKFIDLTLQNIREMCVNAEWAVRMTVDKYREIFDRMEDDYLRGRISDIQYAGAADSRESRRKKTGGHRPGGRDRHHRHRPLARRYGANEDRQGARVRHGHRRENLAYGDRGPVDRDPRRGRSGENHPGRPDQR